MALNFQNRGSSLASRVLVVVLVVVSVASITLYAREGEDGVLHQAQAMATSVVSPLKLVGATAGSAGEDATDTVSDATASDETLSALRERNAELTELLTDAEEYRLEAERLQSLLNMKNSSGVEGVTGRVIGRTTDAWNQTITLDVGTDDGVETGLTVMGASGVVGQVISASAGSSTVRLLSDPASGAAAIVQSSRAEGIVRGSLSGLLYLENIDADVTLSVGDVVLTSGLGGSYTSGLLIGTIVRIDGTSSDGTRRVIVSPNESVSTLEEVIVVLSATGSYSGSSDGGSSDAGSDGQVSNAGDDGSSAADGSSSSASSSSGSSSEGGGA